MRNTLSILCCLLAFATSVAPSVAGEIEKFARPMPSAPNCRAATIKHIGSRLESMDPSTNKVVPDPNSGYEVAFTGTLPDPYMGSLTPFVVFYQGDSANAYVARERAHDPVQLCVVGFPSKTAGGYCDPSKDGRGRMIRVFDVKRGFAYTGPNSEHDCGGA